MLYEIKSGMPFSAYHDIISGSNGRYKAHTGWDAVTDLGSPNLYNLAEDAAYLDVSYGNHYGATAVSTNDVWAVGYYYGYAVTENWNGSTWNVVPNPGVGVPSSIAAVSTNVIWAVGYYYGSNDTWDTLIEQWNGSSWNVVPSPHPPI
jgi:hypothetical protein